MSFRPFLLITKFTLDLVNAFQGCSDLFPPFLGGGRERERVDLKSNL